MARLRTIFVILIIALSSCESWGESINNAGAQYQHQVGYIREYMANQRLFDRLEYLESHPAYLQADMFTQVRMGEQAAQRALFWILREYPVWTLTTYGTLLGILGAGGWLAFPSFLATLEVASPEVRVLASLMVTLPAVLLVEPLTLLGGLAYYSLIPPSIPEASLIYKYGGKKNLLDKSTQNYIEEELFYSFWQHPSAEGFYRLHKILDKALRLPSYTKRLDYDSEKIQAALKNFPSKLVERLDRFALTEIMRQRMQTHPVGHYPVYFHGAPGTGKTYAAKKLAKAMGTNLVTVTLDGATIADIVGTPFENFDSKAGRILDAIISSTASTQELNHYNQVLMIDEFDRLLLSGDKWSEEILSFLLKLLDPTCRYFYSPYLKTDIRLPDTIILAGNSDLRQISESHPQLKAMVSRLNHIEFPGFDSDAKRMIARDSIIPNVEKSFQSAGSAYKKLALTEEDLDKVEAFIQADTDTGLRSLEKYIHDLAEMQLQKTYLSTKQP